MLAADFVNILDENCDLKCRYCAKCKLELTKVTTDLKSAMKIVEILKEERKMNDTPKDKVRVKLCNSEEGTSLSLNNENWTQVTANPKKKNTCKLSKASSTTLRTTNRFEVLHNLNESTIQTDTTKKLTHKYNATSQRHMVRATASSRTNKVKHKGNVLPVCEVLVLYTWSCTSKHITLRCQYMKGLI